LCALSAWLGGCAPAAIEGGFESDNPAARAYAIEHAARNNDLTNRQAIIESLDSDDPLVRMLAISALDRMTGQTLGYRHYDPWLVRQDAVRRWVRESSDSQADRRHEEPVSNSGAEP
jgi:hypothetical protein